MLHLRPLSGDLHICSLPKQAPETAASPYIPPIVRSTLAVNHYTYLMLPTFLPLTIFAVSSERKIDRIEERLTSLVGLLENLKVDSPSQGSDNQANIPLPHVREHTAGIHNTPSTSAPTPASVPASSSSFSYVAPPTTHTDTSDPAFVGESSMAAQYDFANNFLEQVFRAGPLQDFRLEMDETLGALRALVQARKTQNDVREAVFPHARNPLPASPYERTLPNATLAMASLRIAKGELVLM